MRPMGLTLFRQLTATHSVECHKSFNKEVQQFIHE